ncbi:glycosyltransferase family 2 protein [Candidatus Kaiserbacteria bacterium]|nr:glycosyltransferase family 2 protein [Candidatus Kaiserbacteria bacterium]
MKISFVIPAYNEEALLGACLASVLREIKRSEKDAEVIVVNNASTDRTRDIALRYPGVRVVDEPRKGLTFARQAGFVSSNGDFIANIDADTSLPPGWIDTVFALFASDERIVAVSGPYIYRDLPIFIRALVHIFYVSGYLLHLLNQYILHTGAMLQGGNFVLRSEALERIGGFDTSIAFFGEDTDTARRMSKVGIVKWTFGLPMYTSGRRLREEGIVWTAWRYMVNFLSATYKGKPVNYKNTDIRT